MEWIIDLFLIYIYITENKIVTKQLDIESFLVITLRLFFNMVEDRIEKEINIRKNIYFFRRENLIFKSFI